MEAESPFDRVMFVCVDGHGRYSPGVYLHGPDGGGPACLEDARKAAPGMRADEACDSAAGLCGYLFSLLGPTVSSGGGLSLYDAPKPGPDGTVDWQAYCGWNVDLILIDVSRKTADCFVSPEDPKSQQKLLTGRITGLTFGG